eukprot:9107274-Alexandrium_andersonii.AAC.1
MPSYTLTAHASATLAVNTCGPVYYPVKDGHQVPDAPRPANRLASHWMNSRRMACNCRARFLLVHQ